MRLLSAADIRPPSEYSRVRTVALRHVIAIKRDRRVMVGPVVALLFENYETVRTLVEEVLRVEHIEDPERIAEEVDLFSPLFPEPDTLSATLFLQLTDWVQVVCASQFHGLEWCVELSIGSTRCRAVPSDGGDPPGGTSCVHYLRFPLAAAQRAALHSGAEVTVRIEHPNYRAEQLLSPRQRALLAEDLAG